LSHFFRARRTARVYIMRRGPICEVSVWASASSAPFLKKGNASISLQNTTHSFASQSTYPSLNSLRPTASTTFLPAFLPASSPFSLRKTPTQCHLDLIFLTRPTETRGGLGEVHRGRSVFLFKKISLPTVSSSFLGESFSGTDRREEPFRIVFFSFYFSKGGSPCLRCYCIELSRRMSLGRLGKREKKVSWTAFKYFA
jgi:hypothetical protein